MLESSEDTVDMIDTIDYLLDIVEGKNTTGNILSTAFLSLAVQYGFNSRYSTFLRPEFILLYHLFCNMKVSILIPSKKQRLRIS